MPPAGMVASQSPSEHVSLQGVPHEHAVVNEWTAKRVASHATAETNNAESSLKQTSAELPRPLSVKSSVEPSDELSRASIERRATEAIEHRAIER